MSEKVILNVLTQAIDGDAPVPVNARCELSEYGVWFDDMLVPWHRIRAVIRGTRVFVSATKEGSSSTPTP